MEIMKDAKVKRIVVKDDKGKVLLSIPVSWGAAGAHRIKQPKEGNLWTVSDIWRFSSRFESFIRSYKSRLFYP